MIRILALLCVIGAAQCGWFDFLKREPACLVRFDLNIADMGNSAYMEMPLTATEASSEDWVVKTRPGRSEYSSLTLMCKKDNYHFCAFYDDTGYIAGYTINLVKDNFEPYFDPITQGFSLWSTELNGKKVELYSIANYFVSPKYLEKDAETRVSTRNKDSLLQDTDVYLDSFNGELLNVSTTTSYYTNGDNVYTKQACIPFMGHHYYYKMNKDTECTATTISSWFPLVWQNQMIGMGFMGIGKYTLESGVTNMFENPNQDNVKLIVNDGPQCLYDLAGSPGAITMHVYFISDPNTIFCVFEG